MTDKIEQKPTRVISLATAAFLLVTGFCLFHFWGNATRGYIDTASAFIWWGTQWFNEQSETEHGPLVLVVSAWLVWRNLKRISPDVNQPRRKTGLTLIGLALALHMAGYLVQQTRISIAGILLFVIGTAFFAGGRRWGHALLFPCFMLLFAVPMKFLSDFGAVSFHMRMLVIGAAHFMADLIGIDVIRNGTALVSADGSYNYDVAPACSGIRSLLALTALSTLVGYIYFRAAWRWLLLFVLSFPFAFVGNVVRIFSIIITAEYFGEEAGLKAHDTMGYVVFMVVLGLAIAVATLMDKLLPEGEARWMMPSSKRNGTPLLTAPVAAYSCATVFALAAGMVIAIHKVDSNLQNYLTGVKLEANGVDPVAMPKMLNVDWLGYEHPVSDVERQVLPEDTGFSRKQYVNMAGHAVSASIVLSGRDRSSIHRPEICLPGQGWGVVERRVEHFDIPGIPGGMDATVLLIARDDPASEKADDRLYSLYAYWFVGEDHLVATHYQRMYLQAADRLLRLKNHRWAYVSLQAAVKDGDSEKSLERLREVARLLVPSFQTAGFEEVPN